MKRLIEFFKNEEGASAVEYGILVAAIAAVIVVTAFIVGNRTNAALDEVDDQMAAGGIPAAAD